MSEQVTQAEIDAAYERAMHFVARADKWKQNWKRLTAEAREAKSIYRHVDKTASRYYREYRKLAGLPKPKRT